MADEKHGEQSRGKTYYIGGDVGAGATVIMGEHITNIQQMFPKTTDGELLARQFTALIEKIGKNAELDDISRELAMEKTAAVADGMAKATESPGKLHKAIVDAKSYLSSGARWVWEGLNSILTSEAAQKSIGTISEAAVRGAIKSFIGGP